MKYQFIDHYRSRFGVERMCQSLNVSRSGFYSWGKRPESKRAAENGLLLRNIRRIHKAAHGRYGCLRIEPRNMLVPPWAVAAQRPIYLFTVAYGLHVC